MSRIEGVPRERQSWFYRLVRWGSVREHGCEIEPLGVLGQNGRVMAASGMYQVLADRANTVPAGLKALASTKAAMLIGCHF
jgi:hypothetical protein